MRLNTIAQALEGAVVSGEGDPEISSLCYDSREASEGALFFAIRGENADGHEYIQEAIRSRVAAVVVDREGIELEVPTLGVADSRGAMSAIADVFHGRPSSSLKVAGVTGTNGKTTTALMLCHLLNSAHRNCGLLGTVKYDLGGEDAGVTHTTPESTDLQEYLARMVENGCVAAAIEVSSHGIVLKRTADVRFDVAIFTNLSRDHLDFHGDMSAYYEAKRGLFEQVASYGEKKKTLAVINSDDASGRKLLADFSRGSVSVVSYGMAVGSDYLASDLRQTREGVDFTLQVGRRQLRAKIPLIGKFNVYNALAALAAGVGMGLNLREAVRNLADLPQVPGRLESVSDGRAFDVYVDYAHTPDALQNALETLRTLEPRRLIVVFGCGGNRDSDKRMEMGEVASRLSNYAIITSDNPRNEVPEDIISAIESGFKGEHFERIVDRREAIGLGVSYLIPGDILLIAGKGHEDYQEIAGKTVSFDDREVARQMLRDRDHVRADMVREQREEMEQKKMEREERQRGGEWNKPTDWRQD
jgi:UDP-N-acetylmuramoyl-L-alanyl-D-glutamate--2,6-diaminopimelate ligase